MEQPELLPIREKVIEHQCVCLLMHEHTSTQGVTRTLTDKCHAMVASPDEPFCVSCEANGHPERPQFVPLNDPRRREK